MTHHVTRSACSSSRRLPSSDSISALSNIQHLLSVIVRTTVGSRDIGLQVGKDATASW